MKKLIVSLTTITVVAISFISADATYSYTEGNFFHPFDKTATAQYTTRSCPRAYYSLKQKLKREAKSMCAQLGYYGSKILKHKKFTKISCTKIRRHGHKTKVRVKGRFQAVCTGHNEELGR